MQPRSTEQVILDGLRQLTLAAGINDPMPQERLEFLISELGKFKINELNNMFFSICRAWKRKQWPALSDFLEALPQQAAGSGSFGRELRREISDQAAEEFLRSEVGQYALRQGVGHDGWVLIRDGKLRPDQVNYETVDGWVHDSLSADRLAAGLRDSGAPGAAVLLGIHSNLRRMESELFRRFARP